MFKSKLTWYLAGCVLFSLVISFAVSYLSGSLASNYVSDAFDDEEVNKTWQAKYLEDLQQFVDEKDITADTAQDLKEWVDKNSYVYISIYQNGKIIYNSDYTYEDLKIEDTETEIKDSEYLYRLVLADDSVARVDIFVYDYWKYNNYVWAVSIVIGIVLFILIITRLISKKIRYINSLVKELQILEGGNLEYPVTIKGKDEITNLARGIEQMRLSVIDNIKREQDALDRNKELVTSMSHDLRTPLTTLAGYLEMLNMNRVEDDEKRRRYLQLSLDKTKEIKELSDDLFEYFLIYGESEKRFEAENIPIYELAIDLIENQFLSLEEEGFKIIGDNKLNENEGCCCMNGKHMQRVLNNLVSNIRKYADKTKPVTINAAVEDGYFCITVSNFIEKNQDVHESTKIGLITCERIMKLHNGEFQKNETDSEFKVKLSIPMVNDNNI